MTIIQRRLTPDEAKSVHAAIQSIDTITGYSQAELLRFPLSWVATEHDAFLGVIAARPIGASWSTIMLLYVDGDHRAQGVGKALVREAIRFLRQQHRRIHLASCNSIIVDRLERNGFRDVAHLWQLPWPVLRTLIFHALHPVRIGSFIRKRLRGTRIGGFRHAVSK